MNELTMVLDELDDRQMYGKAGNLPPAHVQKLVTALQSEGGDMARIASVIENLANQKNNETAPRYTSPSGSVLMPGNRNAVRTQTAGNGVMSGTST